MPKPDEEDMPNYDWLAEKQEHPWSKLMKQYNETKKCVEAHLSHAAHFERKKSVYEAIQLRRVANLLGALMHGSTWVVLEPPPDPYDVFRRGRRQGMVLGAVLTLVLLGSLGAIGWVLHSLLKI